ncbi:MAG: hypothetical protein Q4D98_14680, partial [Planctomycetia bacterium]|nr:hypothetical protein [Planctomycetia bacterium]
MDEAKRSPGKTPTVFPRLPARYDRERLRARVRAAHYGPVRPGATTATAGCNIAGRQALALLASLLRLRGIGRPEPWTERSVVPEKCRLFFHGFRNYGLRPAFTAQSMSIGF